MNISPLAVSIQRIAVLEQEVKRLNEQVALLSNAVATGSAIPRIVFKTTQEQGEEFLGNQLSPEQIALVKSTKRDGNTTELRRRVVVALHNRGLSGNQIATLLQKDHNCIYYHLALSGIGNSKRNRQYNIRRKSQSTYAKKYRQRMKQNKGLLI
jgi:hypothetical protein